MRIGQQLISVGRFSRKPLLIKEWSPFLRRTITNQKTWTQFDNIFYCSDDILRLISRFYSKNKRMPRRDELGTHRLPDEVTINKHFPNLTFIAIKLGFEPNRNPVMESRVENGRGYRHRYIANHPYKTKNGYVYEHRIIMEQHLGRYLDPKTEFVHHKNGIKSDNRIENLEIVTKKLHHGKVCCPYCNNTFNIR